jgi:hypothetical protein
MLGTPLAARAGFPMLSPHPRLVQVMIHLGSLAYQRVRAKSVVVSDTGVSRRSGKEHVGHSQSSIHVQKHESHANLSVLSGHGHG